MREIGNPAARGAVGTETVRENAEATGAPLGSVVIPAHNEAAVIRRCLDALLAGFAPGELDVIVVCNGCTDDTADVVRSAGYPVRVMEVSKASKTLALRTAEEVLTAFPRLYLDADVTLTAASARQVLERLRAGSALAARPRIGYDTGHSGPLVRSYYRARARLPSVMGSLWGAGVYGLSAAGRARFGEYPDGVGEDLFVDEHFRRHEIEIVDSSTVLVRAPRTVADLLRILRRTYQGKSRYRTLPDSPVRSPATARPALRDLARLAISEPGRAIDVTIYIALALAARLTLVFVTPTHWERDNSSRAA